MCGYEVIFSGSAEEVKAVFGSICRNQNTMVGPLYADKPVLASDRRYSIILQDDRFISVAREEVA